MATVKYSPLVNQIKGRIGQAVFQKCGQLESIRVYVRNKVSQLSPSRSARSTFTYITQTWKLLTQAQRDSFSQYANTYPTKDSYGNTIYLTGYQLYILINTYFMHCASGTVYECLPYSAPQGYNFALGNYELSGHEQVYNGNANIPVDNFLMVYISLQQGNQSNITSRKYIFLGAIDDSFAAGVNIESVYNSSITATFKLGQRYWYYIRQFDVSTGMWIDTPGSFFDIIA